MKLKKVKLAKLSCPGLMELGFKKIEKHHAPAQVLFIKTLDAGFFLTLGLTISNFYNSQFTGTYYLSKTTRWASTWGDIPNESYQRVGFFLNADERKELLSPEYNKEGIRDAWWDIEDNNCIPNFEKAISLTETRFLEQPDLFEKIQTSIEHQKLASFAQAVIELCSYSDLTSYNNEFIQPITKSNIPDCWFKAAEITLKEKEGILNVKTVRALAFDAWIQYSLK